MGRVKKKVATAVAVILFFAGSFGLGIYTGKDSYKSKEQPVFTQNESADRNILYSNILTQAGHSNEGEKVETPAGQLVTEPAGQKAESHEEQGNLTRPVHPTSETLAPVANGQKVESAVVPAQSQVQASGKCVYIYDGDTIRVRLDKPDNRLISLRLLGIDAPELVPGEFGEVARDFLRSLLQDQRVRLVYDQEQYDKYGRTLAYIYLEDGTFINARLVEEGYARVMTIPPNTAHTAEFEKLQTEAQKAQRGIWANPPPPYTWREHKVIKEWYF